jgi:hypothetical protein
VDEFKLWIFLKDSLVGGGGQIIDNRGLLRKDIPHLVVYEEFVVSDDALLVWSFILHLKCKDFSFY